MIIFPSILKVLVNYSCFKLLLLPDTGHIQQVEYFCQGVAKKVRTRIKGEIVCTAKIKNI